MSQLRGRAEVFRRKQRLQAVFSTLQGVDLSPELISHYSRYICVLVSGFAEQSIKELAGHYCMKRSSPEVHRYSRTQLGKLRNFDVERLKQLIQSFDAEWWHRIESRRVDELQAFASVAAVRNAVSHGEDSGITLATIRQYFEQVCVVLDDLCDIFDPSEEQSNS